MEQMLSNDYDDQDGAREIVQREQENERDCTELLHSYFVAKLEKSGIPCLVFT